MLTNTSISGKSEQVQMRPILAIVAACLLCSPTYGQLFPNAFWNQSKQVGSSGGCPGGVCPTAAAPMAIQNTTAGHWSYPGTIDNHLESTHGVSTAGMSRQQKLNLHDSLHEGTQAVVSVPRPIRGPIQSAPSQSFYPAQSQTYGTFKASGGSCGNVASGGSSGGVAVGQRDSLGDVITSVGPYPDPVPSMAPSLPDASVMESRLKDRKASRTAIMESVAKAESEGTITTKQADDIRRAAKRPRMLAQMESLIVEKANSEGYALPMGSDGEVQMGAIPWADLAEFITKIAPLIFKLIDLFSAAIDAGTFKAQQFVDLQTLPQAYPDEWYQAA